MSIIKAPFNFVPLSEKVYFPDWADQISQDIPFSDGVSGTIDLKITAESPIFIRNGHTKEDGEKKNDNYNSFSHVTGPDGKPVYFIPATSIKGEVRTLLEIMSFGKITVDKSAMFARRDLHDKEVYPLLNPNENKKVHCGWLKRDENGKLVITDCGRANRISQPDIDAYIGKNLMRYNFSKVEGINLNKPVKLDGKEYDPKSAVYKYKLLEGYKLNDLHFSEKDENRSGDTIVRVSKSGDIDGDIVLTGQSASWTEPRDKNAKGKYYEFVFPKEEVHAPRELTSEQFNHFSFIYKDSTEWGRIKDVVNDKNKQGVPVFFQANGNEIKTFGLAYLYKLPYDNSVFESLPKNHKSSNEPDLAQCIFGYTDSEDIKLNADSGKNDSLKGRVQFGNAFSLNAREGSPVTLVLGSPKASYYPIYVKQDENGGVVSSYKTYDNGTPSGWKRYYRQNDVWDEKTGSPKLDTEIYPLQKGAVFNSTISFHNLRPVELGALLSALTFNGTDGCKHQLGQAKPYGYGVCKYDVALHLIPVACKDAAKSAEDYMGIFELAVGEKLGFGNDWANQVSIKTLITMAKSARPTDYCHYMKMNNDGKNNEFNNAKKNKESLASVLEILGALKKPASHINEEMKAKYEKEKKDAEERKKQAEQDKKINELKVKTDELIGQIKRIDITNTVTAKQLLQAKKDEAKMLFKDDETKDFLDAVVKACDDKSAEINDSVKSAGLSAVLDEKYTLGTNAGTYKVHNFELFNKKTEKYLKDIKQQELSDEDKKAYAATFKRLSENPSKKEQKQLADKNSKIWENAKEYLGNLFEKLLGEL